MKRFTILTLFLIGCSSASSNFLDFQGPKKTQSDTTVEDFKSRVGYLASDKLGGRSAGSKGDILARDRSLKIQPNDYLVFMDVGAYGSVMSSNYNSRLKPAELLVTKDVVKVIKRKENFKDLIALES